MSSVLTPRACRTAYSSSPKSSPTGPTTRTSVKKLAASEKCTAEPPSVRSRSPKGDLSASNAIDPTTSRLMRRGRLADIQRMTGVYILLAVLAVAALWLVLSYNALVKARNKVDEAWSGIDVQLKRRHDLVPNLVETVKGYAAHERETLQSVTEARQDAEAARGPEQAERAEAKLTSALGAINALAEAYPDLRAAENFQRLQAELAEIEDEIQASRRIYNANVQDYNTRIQVFPTMLIAGT